MGIGAELEALAGLKALNALDQACRSTRVKTGIT
jgi:hypothetical protein